MRALSDCISDMLRTRSEDREIEYLLSRQAGDDANGLASLLATLDLQRLNISVDQKAAEFAATASRLVSPTERTARSRRVRPHLAPRLATAALAAVLVIGLTGVAVASDGAAPGDALYGLDRALERIGVNDGGLSERLTEARILAENGQTARALAHLAAAFGPTSSNAANALDAAADRVAPQVNPSQTVVDDVAAMLEWMTDTDASGQDFGLGVADRAQELGQGNSPPVTLPDTPDNKGNNNNAGGDPGPDTSGGAGNSGNSGGENNGQGGGSDGGNGPPGGTPPGKSGR